MEDFRPLADLATIAGTTPDYLRYLIFKGKLRGEKFGKIWFSKQAWVEECRAIGYLNGANNDAVVELAGKPKSNFDSSEVRLQALNDINLLSHIEKLEKELEERQRKSNRSLPVAMAAGGMVLLTAIGTLAGVNFYSQITAGIEYAAKVLEPAKHLTFSSEPLVKNIQPGQVDFAALTNFLINNFVEFSDTAKNTVAVDTRNTYTESPPQFVIMTEGLNKILRKFPRQEFAAIQESVLEQFAKDTLDPWKSFFKDPLAVVDRARNRAISDISKVFISPESGRVIGEKLETDKSGEEAADIAKPSPPVDGNNFVATEPREVVRREFVNSDEIRNSLIPSLRSDLLSSVAVLNQSLREEFSRSLADLRSSLSAISSRTDGNVRMITLTQKIDSLSGVTLSNATVSGLSGLTDADIPNDITISGTQTLTGLTTTNLTVSGTATFDGSTSFTSGLLVNSASSTITNLSILNSTSTQATSTYLTVSSYASTSALTVSNASILNTVTGSGLFTLNGGLLANSASSTITNLSLINSTTTNATTTYLSLTYGTLTNATSTYLSVLTHASTSLLTVSSPTGTSSFLGVLSIGSSTPASNTLFGVGTSTSLFHIGKHNGLIGIGTTSPNHPLTIFGTATSSIEFSTASGPTNKWTIGVDTLDGHKFKIASSSDLYTNTRLTINGAGYFGLGTTSPSALLSLSNVAGATNNLLLISTTTAGNATATALIIDANGKVGIGTSTPQGDLAVAGTIFAGGGVRLPTGNFAAQAATVQVFTSSGTWTKPAGVKKVLVEVYGGGGSGANGAAASRGGGGGGAGGVCIKVIDVTATSSVTVTVGAAGGTSSFVGHCSATSGSGGSGGSGGDGGTGSSGDINITGGAGSPSDEGAGGGGGNNRAGGTGGSNGKGFGGKGGFPGNNGSVGTSFGGGGGGGSMDSGNGYTGGSGGAGGIIVWEY